MLGAPGGTRMQNCTLHFCPGNGSGIMSRRISWMKSLSTCIGRLSIRPNEFSAICRYGGEATRVSKNCSITRNSSGFHWIGGLPSVGTDNGVTFKCNDCMCVGFNATWHCNDSNRKRTTPGSVPAISVNYNLYLTKKKNIIVEYLINKSSAFGSNSFILTGKSVWRNRCRLRRIDTQPKKRSSGLKSGPGISLCGCELGRHNVSSASCVNNVGTAPAHDRAGKVRGKCGAWTA